MEIILRQGIHAYPGARTFVAAVEERLPYTVVMSSSSSDLFSAEIKKPSLLENVVYSRSLNSVKLEHTNQALIY